MTTNPFNRTLDRSLRGKRVQVKGTDGAIFEGWLDRMHHQKGSAVLHDAVVIHLPDVEVDDPKIQPSGPAYIRTVEWVRPVKRSGKRIVDAEIGVIYPSPYYDAEFEVADGHVRSAYRDGFTGSFPVARETSKGLELINGHKRIAACRDAGIVSHPVELIDVDDETAKELVALAHSPEDLAEEVES